MTLEHTLSIIKPDAVARNIIGKIYSRFEDQGLQIVAAKMVRMTRKQAEVFYAVHCERPFYEELIAYMTSGPVMVQVLEGENAIAKNREIMGATDPKKAVSVHGSDAVETPPHEIAFFFGQFDLCPHTP